MYNVPVRKAKKGDVLRYFRRVNKLIFNGYFGFLKCFFNLTNQ